MSQMLKASQATDEEKQEARRMLKREARRMRRSLQKNEEQFKRRQAYETQAQLANVSVDRGAVK